MSNRSVKTVAGVALVLVLLFAMVGFLRSEPDLEYATPYDAVRLSERAEPAFSHPGSVRNDPVVQRGSGNARKEEDIHPDFAMQFARDNSATVSNWKMGRDTSDPLGGYEALSRANRRGSDKFDPVRDRIEMATQTKETQAKFQQVDDFIAKNSPTSLRPPNVPLPNANQVPATTSAGLPSLPLPASLSESQRERNSPNLQLPVNPPNIPPAQFPVQSGGQSRAQTTAPLNVPGVPSSTNLQVNDFEDRLAQLRKQAEDNRRLDDQQKQEITSIYQREGAPNIASPTNNGVQSNNAPTPAQSGRPNNNPTMNRPTSPSGFVSPASRANPEADATNSLKASLPGLILKEEFWGEQVHPTCYLPQGRDSCAPEFIIAGAMKCGTTSLFEYLLAHPKVLPLRKEAKLNGKTVLALKEVRFFNDPLYMQMANRMGIDKALDEYFNLFPYISPTEGGENYGMITGEASPMYICSKFAGMRTRGALPYGKVILQLRDPIDRAYSEIWFRQSLQRSLPVTSGAGASHAANSPNARRTFDDAYEDAFVSCIEFEMAIFERCNHRELFLRNPSVETAYQLMECIGKETAQVRNIAGDACNLEENRGLCINPSVKQYCVQANLKNSYYFHQIIEWVEAFPFDQIMIIRSEDFYANTNSVMERVASFLGIDQDPFEWSEVTGTAFNIINPGTRSGEGQVTVDSTVPGLKVGAADHDKVGSYPKLQLETRRRLQEWFHEHNQAMSDYLGTHLMWRAGDLPHH